MEPPPSSEVVARLPHRATALRALRALTVPRLHMAPRLATEHKLATEIMLAAKETHDAHR